MSGRGEADQVLQQGRKAPQRERLVAAMTEICARRGYAATTIADTIALAGVSRATFYEHFSDKDDCFTAALAIHREDLTRHIRGQVTDRESAPASSTAIEALLEFAEAHPHATEILVHEALAGGSSTAHIYDELLEGIADGISAAEQRSADALTPLIVPARTLLGGICQALWPRLHDGDTATDRLLDEVTQWADSYRYQPDGQEPRSWRLTGPQRSAFLPDPPLRAPEPLRPGRRSQPEGEVNRNRRERILHATVSVAAAQGYLTMTVDDIVAEAQIARRVFYQHFSDKDDAYVAATDFFSQPLLATAAKAFFSVGTWPERIWRASSAMLEFLSAYPAVAHIMLVDSYAASEAVRRSVRATLRALGLFLEEGYHDPEAERLSRITTELVLAAMSDFLNQKIRLDDVRDLQCHVPILAAILLAPFTGPAAASEFIASKLGSA